MAFKTSSWLAIFDHSIDLSTKVSLYPSHYLSTNLECLIRHWQQVVIISLPFHPAQCCFSCFSLLVSNSSAKNDSFGLQPLTAFGLDIDCVATYNMCVIRWGSNSRSMLHSSYGRVVVAGSWLYLHTLYIESTFLPLPDTFTISMDWAEGLYRAGDSLGEIWP